jgi:hypothetical protein
VKSYIEARGKKFWETRAFARGSYVGVSVWWWNRGTEPQAGAGRVGVYVCRNVTLLRCNRDKQYTGIKLHPCLSVSTIGGSRVSIESEIHAPSTNEAKIAESHGALIPGG